MGFWGFGVLGFFEVLILEFLKRFVILKIVFVKVKILKM